MEIFETQEKLRKIKVGAEELIGNMERLLRENPDLYGKGNIEGFINDFKEIVENRLEIPKKFTIGVAGIVSAGKSSFINALLGYKDIAPTDGKELTGAISKFIYNEVDEKIRANYYFKNNDDIQNWEKIKDLLNKTISEYSKLKKKKKKKKKKLELFKYYNFYENDNVIEQYSGLKEKIVSLKEDYYNLIEEDISNNPEKYNNNEKLMRYKRDYFTDSLDELINRKISENNQANRGTNRETNRLNYKENIINEIVSFFIKFNDEIKTDKQIEKEKEIVEINKQLDEILNNEIESIKEKYLNSNNSSIISFDTNKEQNSSEYKKFTEQLKVFTNKNHIFHLLIKEIIIEIPDNFMKGLEVIDMPGLGSSSKVLLEASLSQNKLDYLLFLVKKDTPSVDFNQGEIFFNRVSTGGAILKKVRFIVTRFDEIIKSKAETECDDDELEFDELKEQISEEYASVAEEVRYNLREILGNKNKEGIYDLYLKAPISAVNVNNKSFFENNVEINENENFCPEEGDNFKNYMKILSKNNMEKTKEQIITDLTSSDIIRNLEYNISNNLSGEIRRFEASIENLKDNMQNDNDIIEKMERLVDFEESLRKVLENGLLNDLESIKDNFIEKISTFRSSSEQDVKEIKNNIKHIVNLYNSKDKEGYFNTIKYGYWLATYNKTPFNYDGLVNIRGELKPNAKVKFKEGVELHFIDNIFNGLDHEYIDFFGGVATLQARNDLNDYGRISPLIQSFLNKMLKTSDIYIEKINRLIENLSTNLEDFNTDEDIKRIVAPIFDKIKNSIKNININIENDFKKEKAIILKNIKKEFNNKSTHIASVKLDLANRFHHTADMRTEIDKFYTENIYTIVDNLSQNISGVFHNFIEKFKNENLNIYKAFKDGFERQLNLEVENLTSIEADNINNKKDDIFEKYDKINSFLNEFKEIVRNNL